MIALIATLTLNMTMHATPAYLEVEIRDVAEGDGLKEDRSGTRADTLQKYFCEVLHISAPSQQITSLVSLLSVSCMYILFMGLPGSSLPFNINVFFLFFNTTAKHSRAIEYFKEEITAAERDW